jgi:putative hydrolase of the HAD superfamily
VPIEAVMFDIGGVLELTRPTGWAAQWAGRLGLDTAEFERRLDRIWSPGSVGAAALEQIERDTAAEFALDAYAIGMLMEDAWEEYLGTLNRELAAYFADLRPRFRTGIVSNSFVGAREREQAAYRFEEICDDIVYSHEVGLLKPDPQIYRLACARLDVRAEEAVMLDDVGANVEGARAVGMHAITFHDTTQAIAELDALLHG